MNCPHCQAIETKVIETRLVQQGKTTRRRRECEHCSKRFTTYETIATQIPSIIKRDGRREPFRREKILSGLTKACEKRPVSMTEIEDLINCVEKSLTESNKKEISSDFVGNMIMEKLDLLDPVSYVRFASFYWSFNDVSSFVQELQNHNPREINYEQ